jgi:hypothetical protein
MFEHDKISKWSIQHRKNLLTAAQFLLPLRYDDKALRARLQKLLGGRQAMTHSSLYQEIVDETRQQDILALLEDRFGAGAKDVEPLLTTIPSDRLRELLKVAGRCRSLASFRKQLL